MTQPTCKCHGVSGSCSLKTCWMQVPDFRRVGNALRERYGSAMEVRSTNSGRLKSRFASSRNPTSSDLVYLDSSPDYCRSNPEMAVLGTVGRECQMKSAGIDGCGLMCCGRGYSAKDVIVESSCHCKFQWCCYVRCETCRTQIRKYICHWCNRHKPQLKDWCFSVKTSDPWWLRRCDKTPDNLSPMFGNAAGEMTNDAPSKRQWYTYADICYKLTMVHFRIEFFSPCIIVNAGNGRE